MAGLNCANTGLTVIEYRETKTPGLLMFNDMGHLPDGLRWSGFGGGVRP